MDISTNDVIEVAFLTTEQVVDIQASTLPNSGLPDFGRLEGALGRVTNLCLYEGCEDIFELAAMYLISIAKAHAFNDANKRTAFQAASIFLMMNGFSLLPSSFLVKLTVWAAMDNVSKDEVAFSMRLLSDYDNQLLDDYPSDYDGLENFIAD